MNGAKTNGSPTKAAASPPIRKHAASKGPNPHGSREANRVAAVILEVLAGVRTPTQAAEVLGISLPRFYLWEQRAVEGLVSACEPRSKGRTVTPQRHVAQLEKQVLQLQQQCVRHQSLVRAAQRTIGLAPPPAAPAKAAGKVVGSGRKKGPRRPMVRALKVAIACRQASEGAEPAAVGENSVAAAALAAVQQSSAPGSQPVRGESGEGTNSRSGGSHA